MKRIMITLIALTTMSALNAALIDVTEGPGAAFASSHKHCKSKCGDNKECYEKCMCGPGGCPIMN